MDNLGKILLVEGSSVAPTDQQRENGSAVDRTLPHFRAPGLSVLEARSVILGFGHRSGWGVTVRGKEI